MDLTEEIEAVAIKHKKTGEKIIVRSKETLCAIINQSDKDVFFESLEKKSTILG